MHRKPEYRALTLNIHKGFSASNLRYTLEALRVVLRDSKCNVVFLQEVSGENSRYYKRIKGWPNTDQLEYLADSVWPHFAYGRNAATPLGHHGNAILNRLVADGLCLYLIPAPFIHSKALVIDNDYSLIGSANIDPRSLRLNFELGLELFSFECNAWLAHYFHSLFAESHWLDPRAPETRPYLVRLRDALAWLFSPYL